MVHFPGFARARLWIHRAVWGFYPHGFPHSEIPGSMPTCGSPRLIAACHVLHRLLLPRHPPCALSSLTIKFARSTAASPQLSAISLQLSAKPPTPSQILRCAILLIARVDRFPASPGMTIPKNYHRTPEGLVLRTPAELGTHKNLQPCRLPNLFSCQTSSSLEPPLVFGRWLLAKNLKPSRPIVPPERVEHCCSKFGAKRLSFNRDEQKTVVAIDAQL
jgi:hypothetical protein